MQIRGPGFGSSEPMLNSGVVAGFYNYSTGEAKAGESLGASGSANPAVSLSSSFGENPYLKNLDGE